MTRIHSKIREQYPRKAFVKSPEPCGEENHICEFACSMDHCCEYMAEAIMEGTMKWEYHTYSPPGQNANYAYCPYCGEFLGCSPQVGILTKVD